MADSGGGRSEVGSPLRLRPSPGDRGPSRGRPGVSGPRRPVRSLPLRAPDDPGGVAGLRGLRRRRLAQAAILGRTVGELSDAVRTASSQRSRPDAVRAYPKACLTLAGKAEGSLEALKGAGCPEPALDEIGRLVAHVRRFAGQIERRVLRKEKIPHGEKVFSIFEEHTRWISKGKAGKKVELGVPVCIVEDGNGFVLGHEILWTGGDADVAVPLVERSRKAFPDLRGCSFDRGFHSPPNRKKLDDLLEPDALPKKGRLSAAERERMRQDRERMRDERKRLHHYRRLRAA